MRQEIFIKTENGLLVPLSLEIESDRVILCTYAEKGMLEEEIILQAIEKLHAGIHQENTPVEAMMKKDFSGKKRVDRLSFKLKS